MDEDQRSEPADPAKEEVARTASETGIPVEQAEQLARATEDKEELDSAAEAAARWS